MKHVRVLLVVFGLVLLITGSALAFSLTENFTGATINQASLTTTSGLNQWNDLVRWQIQTSGGNTGDWAQQTPRPDSGPEESLLFYGFDAAGLGAGTAFSLDFDFINQSGSFNGRIYVGGLLGTEKISPNAPWPDLGSTYFKSAALSTNVNSWMAFPTLTGLVDADYDVLYIAFQMGGRNQLRGIDNVNLQVGAPVPEPASIILLGGGLLGLAWYGRKRKKA